MAHTMFIGSGKRSGTRGGADQFTWEKVKNDKYKDFYLGHSLHTTTKPTFNNRKPNPLWWTKTQGSAEEDEARRRAEIEAIKREEEQLHLEALGLAPRRRKAQENQLDSIEIQELTRRGNTERDAYDGERVAGLGYAPAPLHQLGMEGTHKKTEERPAEDQVPKNHIEQPEKKSKEERREEKREKRRRKEEKREEKKKKKERKEKKERDRHITDKHSERRHGHHEHESEEKRHHRKRPREEDESRGEHSRRRHRHRSRSPSQKSRDSTSRS